MIDKLSKKHADLLTPMANLLDEICYKNDTELDELLVACKAVSNTNCWYCIYDAGQALVPFIEKIQRQRKHAMECGRLAEKAAESKQQLGV